jgi:vacuolar-type H+-ATPase subunit I/STV1
MSDLKKHQALIASIAAAFVANPTAQELHVTIDGNCFLAANKNAAELHARRIGTPANTISRSDFESEKMDELQKALDDKIAAENAIIAAEESAKAEAAEKEASEKLAAEELVKAEKEAAEKAAAELEDAGREEATGKQTAKSKTTKK